MRLTYLHRSLWMAALAATICLALPAVARAASLHVSVVGSDTAGNGSVGNPYKTVQHAVGIASSGDDVFVGPGTFSGAIAMKNGVSLQGAGAGETTLTGTPFIPIITATGIGASTSISGFTISGNNYSGIRCENSSLAITDDKISGNYGGGIVCYNSSPTITDDAISGNGMWGVYCADGSAPTITGNTINSNSINGPGSGIGCDDSSPAITDNAIGRNGDGIECVNASSPTIAGNSISWNHYGIECDGSSPFITTNTISASSSSGIHCDNGSSPVIINCTLDSQGQGDGIDCDNGSSPTITRDTISGSSYDGIWCNSSSSPTITNCTISGNVIYGIQCVNSSSPTITNNTISGNWTGGIRCYDAFSLPTITNCIVWNPGGTELTDCTATYSDVLGGAAGIGNIDADPSFVDATTGDFHLSAGSPCINAATSAAAPATDKDGVPRPYGIGYEMGAYEYHALTCRLHYEAADSGGSILGAATQVVDFYTSGTPVEARSVVGHHFVKWSDDSTANPRTDSTVTEDATYTASFAINTYTLKYAPGIGGTLGGNTSQTVAYGANGTMVTAIPAPGYRFVRWSDGTTANPRQDTSVAANVNVTATFAMDTSIALSSKSNPLLGYGSTFAVKGTLKGGGVGLVGKSVILQSAAPGTSFRDTSYRATTGTGGAFSFSVKPTSKTYYRVRFAGATGYSASGPTAYVYATPKAYVGNTVAPATMYRTSNRTVYGYLKPRHTAGTYPVRIYKYRYVSGKWKSYGYITAKATNYYSYSKYSRAFKLPYAGRWRLRAYAPADSLHAAAWSSGYDYVTVK